MQGPTLTMSTAFKENGPFHRSHSSPNIPDLLSFDFQFRPARPLEEFPRSASFTSLPTLDGQLTEDNGTARALSLEVPPETSSDVETNPPKADTKIQPPLSKEETQKVERIGRRKSLIARPKSWIQRAKSSPDRQTLHEPIITTPIDAPPVPVLSKATWDTKTKSSVTGSLASFARKSFLTSSRSPSPSRNKLKKDNENGGSPSRDSKNLAPPKIASVREEEEEECPPDSDSRQKFERAPSAFQKLRHRPQSVLMNLTNFQSANSSTSSLPTSSMDNRSTPRTSTDKIPPLTKNISAERLSMIEMPRRRDELWSAFRTLENDFTKFQSKSWSLKTNVVRASLLPFLRAHALHPSNKLLRAEDLDRRVAILNKWWTGLLEVLDGRQNQTVSGVDRPILLDACYAIMTRPEWRTAPSAYAPLCERLTSPVEPLTLPRKRSSAASLNSSASQFMIESVYHNTRNLFIQNLLAQMNFVVDKMSLRHAPASLVTFCGKAAAYAFFFVPGVADMLVRIWKLQADMLQRVSNEFGMPKRPNRVDMDEVIAGFPTHMHSLGWSSAKQLATQLRRPPNLPIMAGKIAWFGPWVARWCGRDSDLFFVFAKHYHILAEEFLPLDLTLLQKARCPGFMLVQAQILAAVDATIHRQPAADPLPITFDEVLAGADATAPALPLPSTNSARLMAENRLIVLLRDFVSERPSEYEAARMTFAESFSKVIQAGARRTSLFDHNACFVLCDFMEESLSIFLRFHHTHALESDFIDWYFWLDVCQKMLESQNSMLEIRLFAFLFGAWNVISIHEKRKEAICLDWLLTEETFDKFFNHWCPMVRAYYMRLLCWRVCRDDGDASELDTKIFTTVLLRLKTTWSHYLFLKQSADKNELVPPSTAPCHPAPGRRLLIIRNDNQASASNLFLGLDGIVPQQGTKIRRSSMVFTKGAMIENATTDEKKPEATAPNKKRWTFMGKLPFAGTSSSSNPDASPSYSPPKDSLSSPVTKTLDEARRETANSRSRPLLHAQHSSSDSETPPSSITHRTFSFKFSLEWTQHFEKPTTAGVRGGVGFNMGAERRLVAPRLPAIAQATIGSRVPNMGKEVTPRDPREEGVERGMRSKYSGRALAEWFLIIAECNNFSERRRSEGVPNLRWVEVPTLGIEGFRRFGQ